MSVVPQISRRSLAYWFNIDGSYFEQLCFEDMVIFLKMEIT